MQHLRALWFVEYCVPEGQRADIGLHEVHFGRNALPALLSTENAFHEPSERLSSLIHLLLRAMISMEGPSKYRLQLR